MFLPHFRSETEEGYSSEEDESFEGLRVNKMAQTFLSDPNTNPIAYYQSLWGMNNVEIKFSPEALEVVANQATKQNAGEEGMHCILEKLFLNLKFDMPPDIDTVEVTEDVILGRKPPNYLHKKSARKLSKKNVLAAINEENESTEDNCENCGFASGNAIIGARKIGYLELGNYKRKIRLPSRLSDYEMAICDQMEI